MHSWGDQEAIPCSIYRGGTSKAVCFLAEALPKDRDLLSKTLLKIMGSPDPRQIDGLGGADPLTTKVAIVSRSKDPEIDIECQFVFVYIQEALVDFESFCGNILAAAVCFAVNEGLVIPLSPLTKVRILDLNTKIRILAEIPLCMGKTKTQEAPIKLHFDRCEGTFTGSLLPTGNPIDLLDTSFGTIEASFIDYVDPVVFVSAQDLHLQGNEKPEELPNLACVQLEEIRNLAAQKMGISCSGHLPKVVFISPVQKGLEGLVVRMLILKKMHKAYGVSCGICTAAAAHIPGSLVHRMHSFKRPSHIILHHPAGEMKLEVDPKDLKISIERTSRCLMRGEAMVKNC